MVAGENSKTNRGECSQNNVHFLPAGLGLYEYMLLANELDAEPIYVVNNGISHQQSVPPDQLQPFIDETMEALEFLTGDSGSTWGSVRASMGREDPWDINYLAIGNEVHQSSPMLHDRMPSDHRGMCKGKDQFRNCDLR